MHRHIPAIIMTANFGPDPITTDFSVWFNATWDAPMFLPSFQG
jgi:hypothetical protein